MNCISSCPSVLFASVFSDQALCKWFCTCAGDDTRVRPPLSLLPLTLCMSIDSWSVLSIRSMYSRVDVFELCLLSFLWPMCCYVFHTLEMFRITFIKYCGFTLVYVCLKDIDKDSKKNNKDMFLIGILLERKREY